MRPWVAWGHRPREGRSREGTAANSWAGPAATGSYTGRQMTLAPRHELHQLNGGGRLLTAELPDRASVSIVLLFGVGSRFEEDRIGGVSHFIEHLFFKGTARRPTAKEIAEAIEGVGG